MLVNTPFTLTLAELKLKRKVSEKRINGIETFNNQVQAVLISVNNIPGYWSEYLLSTYMRSKGQGDIFFSFARHEDMGFYGNDVVMYAQNHFQLGSAVEFWIKEFDGEIQMLEGFEVPTYNIGAPFHFALDGAVRISKQNIKYSGLLGDDQQYLVFAQPNYNPKIRIHCTPGYCLTKPEWRVTPEQWEYMFVFQDYDQPRKFKIEGKAVKVSNVEIAEVHRFFSLRAANTRNAINDYSKYAHKYLVESQLDQTQKDYREGMTDQVLENISDPADRWAYLDVKLGFYYSTYSIEEKEKAMRKYRLKRQRRQERIV